MRSFCLLVVLAVSSWAGVALADPAPADATPPADATARAESTAPPPDAKASTEDPEKGHPTPPATRRSGFTAGLLFGLSLGTADGYPNEFSKIGDPGFQARTSGLGGAGGFWLGGALTDWFTFGLGWEQTSFGSSKLASPGGAFLFHIETFPLFTQGGNFRDLGVFADVGTGTATVIRRTDKREYASSGSLSILGLGAFWETWRVAHGHLTAGPVISWQYQSSDPMTRYFGILGLRGAFYGGP